MDRGDVQIECFWLQDCPTYQFGAHDRNERDGFIRFEPPGRAIREDAFGKKDMKRVELVGSADP
jgi:hypothetical protein